MHTTRFRLERRATRFIGLTVLLVGVISAFLIVLSLPEAPSTPALLHVVAAEPDVTGRVEPTAATGAVGALDPRPVYRHSVVPGGVHSATDVDRVIRLDPVVRAHYNGLDVSSLRVVTVTEPRMAYVSYRVGDQVYWTDRQVRLEAGEQLLTDGTVEIRARCGNLVSDSTVEHTLVDSTPAEALDEIEPEAAPLLAAVNERIGTPAFLEGPAATPLGQVGSSLGSAAALGAVVPPVLLAGGVARGALASGDGPGRYLEIPTGACVPGGF
jgi:hypothetical protein